MGAASRGQGGSDTAITIFDPLSNSPTPLVVSKERLCDRWQGTVLLLKRSYKITDRDRPFGFLWFFAEIIRERGICRDVAIAGIVLHMLGFATPLFFQILVDKVLVHESYATLYVLGAGIIAALLFEFVFTYLRRFLLVYATAKIDVRVGCAGTASTGAGVALPLSPGVRLGGAIAQGVA